MTVGLRDRDTQRAGPPPRGALSLSPIRLTSFACVFGLMLSALLALPAWSQDKAAPGLDGQTPPMPPARPSTLAPAKPQAPPPSSIDIQSLEPQGLAESEGPDELLQLPPASRARMHECAVEWQKRKEAGATREKVWFNFAQTCLTR